MVAYGELIREVTARRAEQTPKGEPFDVRELTEAISLEVIVRAVFGVEHDADAAMHTVANAMNAVTPLVLFVRAARKDLGRFSPGGKLARAHAKGDALLRELMDERRRDTAPRADILSMVLGLKDEHGNGLSDVEMVHELRTMLAAGHETTATALSWAMHYLHRHPEVLGRVLDEVRPNPAPAALGKAPYLSAVCNETLRVRPIVADVMRMVKEPITVRGIEVPAGHPVCAAVSLTHRLPELYPEPDAFKPERFLDRRFSPYEFAPFGGGVRRCLGADFALFEMRIVLGTLLANHAWTLVDPREIGTRLRNLTVGPAQPIRIVRT
jgi:cytochrome P450